MPVVSYATSKGGAGKTTSCIVLAGELSQFVEVVVIDADPAARLYRWSTLAPLPPNLSVVRSGGERLILDEIDAAQERARWVLVDLEGVASRTVSYAMSLSDLVLVPAGEEQQDADAALETLSEVERESRARRKTIPAAILLARTNAAVKSRLERFIATELRRRARVLEIELNRRTAFSALHNSGGTLRQLDDTDVNGVGRAIENATAHANEVITILEEARNAAAV